MNDNVRESVVSVRGLAEAPPPPGEGERGGGGRGVEVRDGAKTSDVDAAGEFWGEKESVKSSATSVKASKIVVVAATAAVEGLSSFLFFFEDKVLVRNMSTPLSTSVARWPTVLSTER